ncbi:MAG: DUF3343 domain-containing protein [Oscillospiraceae bacterium]|nr:DUF3343 domain-containing protein [Oscillospiraceae bacterium]
MTSNLIAMSSITYAIKAKKLLISKGLRCEITRTPKNLGSGCGYSIRVFNPTDDILRILEGAKIKWNDYTTN